MIPDLLIALSEVQKLGLLYLALQYDLRSTAILIFMWTIWQLFSSVIFGKLSDIKGRKSVFFITVLFSVVVSMMVQKREIFPFALLVNGMFVAILPVAFAAKNDQYPTKSKRLTYAEASLARAIPWLVFPWVYMQLGFLSSFWLITLPASALASAVLLIFFKDKRDKDCMHMEGKSKAKTPAIFTFFVIGVLGAYFFAESSYQTIAYLTEEQENIVGLSRAYLLFGLGMSITSGLHLLVKKLDHISLKDICSYCFFIIFFYFFIKYISFSWDNSKLTLTYTEKTILGAASGTYIPLIYALICERYRIHQQGVLCGLLELVATMAELISPAIAYLFIVMQLKNNTIFLIIGLGFFGSYIILKKHHFLIKKIGLWGKAFFKKQKG